MSQLKVVWRNSRPVKRERRWHELACDVGRKLYVVEKLVPQGGHKRWAQAVALEVMPGSRAIAAQNGSPLLDKHPGNWSLRYLAITRP
jgi:hypothetical protein